MAAASAGREAVELAASAGLVLDPWQEQVLVDALGERADGQWAAFEVALIVARQNGKGSILEALELACLFLFGDGLILHSAHEFKTAQEAFRRILGLVENTDDLRRRCKKPRTSHGEEGLELLNGNRLRFVARSTGSGRGFSGDKIILDEAYNLSATAMAALFPTMAARQNPQIWYTSSAPLPRPESDVLRRLCQRGRSGQDTLAYLEWSADPNLDRGDPEAWAQANPGLDIRISREFVSKELAALTPEDFDRERLGIYPESIDGTEKVIPPEAWAACEDRKSGPVGGVAFALDVSPDRSSGSFAVAGVSGKGGSHVELVDHRPGTDWMVARAKELQERWEGAVAVAAGSPAEALLEALERAGVWVRVVSVAEHTQACGALYDTIVQHQLRHLGQTALNVAVSGADKRMRDDAWLWSRKNSTVDITPLVAVTLALWLHTQGADPATSVW